MYKVNVSVPAVITNVGPGYDVLGLALNLRNTIEMSLNPSDRLTVQVRGEGKGRLPEDYYNPVMTAAIALFQQLEQAPVGLNVVCTNHIPLDVGLSARVAMIVGGLVGANNLLGSPYRREDLIGLATEICGQPEAVVTAMRGGLGICASDAEGIFYRALEIAPLRVVVALPNLRDYEPRLRDDLPPQVPMSDAVHNVGHAALLIEALRSTDFKLLRYALRDELHEPYRTVYIPGYEAVVDAAHEAGAIGVVLCGAGPAMLAFATYNHAQIESAMQGAFRAVGVEARTWALSVDSQGVVISVVQ
ncbi:MAG: homoserine kinase [Chloroflexi bacterium]|jgi:homoserine kinase|nr:homoserine kinase [Chloroflexota bacterium]